MPVGRSPPPNRLPPGQELTKCGVKRKKEGSTYKYFDETFRKSWLIIDTFTERNGFNPETGLITDSSQLPLGWEQKLKYPGDANETLLEDTSNRSELDKENSTPSPSQARDSGAIGKDTDKNSPEASATSTPSKDAETVHQKQLKLLNALEEWKNWAKRQNAIFAKKPPLPDWPELISTPNLRFWKQYLENSQVQELKDLLVERQVPAPMDLSDSDVGFSLHDSDRQLESRLSSLRVSSDEMRETHGRAVEFLERNLGRLREYKVSPVDPLDIPRMFDVLRNHSHKVKTEFLCLCERWENQKRSKPQQSSDLSHISLQLDKVYHNLRRLIRALIKKYMQYLAETAIPTMEYHYRDKMGINPGEKPVSVVASSIQSMAESWNSLFEDINQSSFEVIKEVQAESDPKTTSVAPSSRPYLYRSGPNRESIPPLPQGGEEQNVLKTDAAPNGGWRSNFWKSIDNLSSRLREKQEELALIRIRVSNEIDEEGNRLQRPALKMLRDKRDILGLEIQTLETELRLVNSGSIPRRQNDMSRAFAPGSSSTRFPTPGKEKNKTRRSISFADENPRNLEFRREEFESRATNRRGSSSRNHNRREDMRNERSTPRSRLRREFPAPERSATAPMLPPTNLTPAEMLERQTRREQEMHLSSSDEESAPFGRQDVADLSRNFGGARMRTAASGGSGDPYGNSNERPHRHRRNRNQNDRQHNDQHRGSPARSQSHRSYPRHGNAGDHTPPRNPRDGNGGEYPPYRREGGDGNKGPSRHNGNGRRNPPFPPNDPGGWGGGGGGSDPSDGGGSNSSSGQENTESDAESNRNVENHSYVNARDLVTELNRQDRSSEVWDGFEDVDSMEHFYRSLPRPWNIIPKTKGKKAEILKTIQMSIPETMLFAGKTKDGSYFDWRIQVLETIHRQALSVSDKILQLKRSVRLDKDMLRNIFSSTIFTATAYKNIIESLENTYGGDMRAHAFLRDRMFSGAKVDLDDLHGVSLVRTKIERYLEFVQAHRIQKIGDNLTILEMVLSNVFMKHQVLEFRKECMQLQYDDVHNLRTLANWLRYKETLLQWTERNWNPNLMGAKRAMKASTHKTTLVESIEGESSPTVLVAGTNSKSASHSKEKQDKRSTLLTAPESLGVATSSEESGPEGENQEETDSLDTLSDREHGFEDEVVTDDENTCLTVMGVKLPSCTFCSEGRHLLNKCEKFLKISVKDRFRFIQKEKRCANCLSPKHKTKECTSTYRCLTCGLNHHTLLHFTGIPDKAKNPS